MGRRVLTQSLLAPIALYACSGWSEVKVSQIQEIQDILDMTAKSKFRGNIKFFSILEGGCGIENIFSQYVSTQVSFFQRQLLANTHYYANINEFLIKNLKLKLDFAFNHGIKMINLICRTLE